MKCPVEHTRIRIQIQRGQADKVYTGSLDAAIKIFKQRVRLSTGVKNIFNNTQLLGTSGGSGHGGGDGASSLVGWGRTYFLGINYNFTKN